MRADADRLSDFGESAGVDHALAEVSEDPFGKCIELAKCDVSNHPSEHGVAKKFESFVAVFVPPSRHTKIDGPSPAAVAADRELVANRGR